MIDILVSTARTKSSLNLWIVLLKKLLALLRIINFKNLKSFHHLCWFDLVSMRGENWRQDGLKVASDGNKGAMSITEICLSDWKKWILIRFTKLELFLVNTVILPEDISNNLPKRFRILGFAFPIIELSAGGRYLRIGWVHYYNIIIYSFELVMIRARLSSFGLLVFVTVVKTSKIVYPTRLLTTRHACVRSHWLQTRWSYCCTVVSRIEITLQHWNKRRLVLLLDHRLPVYPSEPRMQHYLLDTLDMSILTFIPNRSYGFFLKSPSNKSTHYFVRLNSGSATKS